MSTPNDDDYVVSLLVKDAEANRKRYMSNSRLGSLLSRKPRGNAPKPNTRFLKNIIRETDSHNAALKAKEEGESRARLKDLKRKRDRADEDGGGKRSKEDRPGRWASALGGLSKGKEREDERDRHRGRRRDRSRGSDDSRRWHRRRHSGAERERSRSRSPNHRKEHRQRERSRTPPCRNDKLEDDGDSGSDPLGNFLGPKPPSTILTRGRGAHKTAAASIDSRFASSYNPKTDVDLSVDEAEGDDWDMSLEALKDRAKWRAHGAERLRDAGFTEEEVGRWENNTAFPNGGEGGERNVSDVRWRKKGEGREWDRGKVVGNDSVDVKPKWARPKG